MKRKLELLAAVLGTSALIGGVAVAASSPSVDTGRASHVAQHSAVLHGTVNPNGSSTTYFFQWGLTNAYGVNGKAHSAGAGDKAVAVQQTAGGLIPGTTYHYRLVATNAVGTSVGRDRTFTTAGHPPPGVTTGPATGLSTSGATLTGVVNPAGAATTWWFEWGGSTAYGQETAPQTLPLHCATRMLATPSATRQSPVGSAASAGTKPVAKKNPEKTILRARVLGQCNMVQTYALVMIQRGQNAALSVFS